MYEDPVGEPPLVVGPLVMGGLVAVSASTESSEAIATDRKEDMSAPITP